MGPTPFIRRSVACFATFLSTYKVILETAHKLGLNLIFRPHPLFEKNLLNTKKISVEEYTEFKKISRCLIGSYLNLAA